MASNMLSRSLLYKQAAAVFAVLGRSSSSLPRTSPHSFCLLRSLRPAFAASYLAISSSSSSSARSFATRSTTSSLNDPSPNWSNRPPKETILLDGCDFNHWLVVMEPPEVEPTRDEIIDSYIKTLAMVVGSEDEARMKIYSVSTRCYYAFGALVSEELSYKIKELPRVRWVLPDSYLDVKNKDYGGEPFIDGKAVPYDPKYHEEWIRNNARANERNRRNDRPRNSDRSRNYERRRENMQNRDFQSTRTTPMSNQGFQNSQSNMGMPNQGVQQNPASNVTGMPQNSTSGQGGPLPPPPPNNYMRGPPPPPPPPNNYMGGPPPNNAMGVPPPPPPQYNSYSGGPPPPQYNSYSGGPPPPPPNNYMGHPHNVGGMPSNSMGSTPPNNIGGTPPNNIGGMPPNAGWSSNMPGYAQQNYQNGSSNGSMLNHGDPSNYHN